MSMTWQISGALLSLSLGLNSCGAAHENAAARSSKAAGQAVPVSVCVTDSTGPTLIEATYRPIQGDTVVETATGPMPWRDFYSRITPHAQGRGWYENGETVVLRAPTLPGGADTLTIDETTYISRHRYRKLREPVILTPDALAKLGTRLQRVGEYDGVPLYTESDTPRPPEMYLVPVRPGCEFQIYVPFILTRN